MSHRALAVHQRHVGGRRNSSNAMSRPLLVRAAHHVVPPARPVPSNGLQLLIPSQRRGFFSSLHSQLWRGATSDGEAQPAAEDQEEREKKSEARLQRVQQALKDGTLGFGFSAGGFLYPYHLGVLWELRERQVLKDYKVRMAGASAGSLAIATYNCGLEVPATTKALSEFAQDCRSNGTRGRLGLLLRDFLHAYLPDDAHERCRGVTYVAVTRVFPYMQAELVSEFDSKDDFVSALITSCHIPMYANGQIMTKFRGRYYMDGGVANFVPSPPTREVIKVCCFPVNEVLSKVPESVTSLRRVGPILDIPISPDAFEPYPYDYQTMLKWALLPAEDEVLASFVAKGRRDAAAWARAMQLVPHEEGDEAATDAAAASTERGLEDYLRQRQNVHVTLLQGAGSAAPETVPVPAAGAGADGRDGTADAAPAAAPGEQDGTTGAVSPGVEGGQTREEELQQERQSKAKKAIEQSAGSVAQAS